MLTWNFQLWALHYAVGQLSFTHGPSLVRADEVSDKVFAIFFKYSHSLIPPAAARGPEVTALTFADLV